mmetsp:Transcript_756/g.1611  ORF Transcript_756/g.1611 Transcript_756/m.1611 type:complete len:206 (-) Transcript_756:289-906(-)
MAELQRQRDDEGDVPAQRPDREEGAPGVPFPGGSAAALQHRGRNQVQRGGEGGGHGGQGAPTNPPVPRMRKAQGAEQEPQGAGRGGGGHLLLQPQVRLQAAPHKGQLDPAQGDAGGEGQDHRGRRAGPPVPGRRCGGACDEGSQDAVAPAPHLGALQAAQIQCQRQRSQEADRVPHRQGVLGARQGQPVALHLPRVICCTRADSE